MRKLTTPRLAPYEYGAERCREGMFVWAGRGVIVRRFENREQRDEWVEEKKLVSQELFAWSLLFWPVSNLWIQPADAFAIQSKPWRKFGTTTRTKLSPAAANFLREVTIEVDEAGWQIWSEALENASAKVKTELFSKALVVQYDPVEKHESRTLLTDKPPNQKYLLTPEGKTVVRSIRGLPKRFQQRNDLSIKTMISRMSERVEDAR